MSSDDLDERDGASESGQLRLHVQSRSTFTSPASVKTIRCFFPSLRVHRQSAGQDPHVDQGGADAPTQEDEEQDGQMQAVRQLHRGQRRGVRGGAHTDRHTPVATPTPTIKQTQTH